MRYELKSIGIWSFVKVSFFVNLVLGFIIGFFYASFIGLFLSIAGNSPLANEWGIDPNEMSIGVLFIMFPILFGIMGAFFQTLLMTLIVGMYNLVTKMTGGLVLNLASVEEPATNASVPIGRQTPVAPAQVVAPLPPPPPPAAPQAVKMEPAQPTEPVIPSPQPEPVQPKPTEPPSSIEPSRVDSEKVKKQEDKENKQDDSPNE